MRYSLRAVLPAVLAAALLALSGSPLFAQVVQVRAQHGSAYSMGNGFVVGKDGSRVLIVTVAHNVRGVAMADVIDPRWYPADVLHRDEQADVALLRTRADGFVDIPFFPIDPTPASGEVTLVTYWPSAEAIPVWRRRRLRAVIVRGDIGIPVVPGVSGAPIIRKSRIVGMVFATDPVTRTSLYVRSSVIHSRLTQWGYSPCQNGYCPAPQIKRAPQPPPIPNRIIPEPDPISTPGCDCKQQFATIRSDINRLKQSIGTLAAGSTRLTEEYQSLVAVVGNLTTRIDELENRDGSTEITALSRQIDILQKRVESASAQQGPAGKDGTVTVRIIENGKQLYELKNLKPGTNIDVPITRTKESSR